MIFALQWFSFIRNTSLASIVKLMASLSSAKGYSTHYANRQKKKTIRSLDCSFLHHRLPKGRTACTKNKFRSISVGHFHCVLLFFKDLNMQNYTEHLENCQQKLFVVSYCSSLAPCQTGGVFPTYKLLHSLIMVIRTNYANYVL